MIAIVDYDTGNLCSVENVLRRLGADFQVSADPDVLRAADRVLLPGVGEASSSMDKLRERGLDQVVCSLTRPVLGICIGMQLMCRCSEEGETQCLGIFDASVRRFNVPGVKIPHMGWNTLEALQTPLFKGIDEGSYIYYVHSFAPEVCAHTIATTHYGLDFSAALGRDNFFGTQFHPEKSGGIGERIIQNFLTL